MSNESRSGRTWGFLTGEPHFPKAFWILLASVCGLYALGINGHLRFQRDGTIYLSLARSMVEEGSYTYNYEPYTKYSPGFPAMLAGVGYFTGMPDTLSDSFLAFNILVSLCGIASICVFYLILRELETPPRIALWALLFYAFARTLYYYSAHLLTDVPFTLFALGALWAAIKMGHSSTDRARWGWCIGAGLLAAAACIIRPVGPLLVPAIMAGVWLHRDALQDWMDRLARSVGVVLIVALPTGFWSWWTYSVETTGKAYFRNKMGSSAIYNVLLSPLTRFVDHMEGFSGVICGTRTGTIAGTLLFVAMAVGFVRWLYEGEREMTVFALLCFAAIVGGGWELGDRYLLPALPAICYATVLGGVTIGRYLMEKTEWWNRKRTLRAAYIFCGLILAINFIRVGKVVYENRHPSFYEVVDEGRFAHYRPIFEWLRANARKKDTVLGFEASSLHYFTRLHTQRIRYSTEGLPAAWLVKLIRAENVDYVVRDMRQEDSVPVIDKLRSQHSQALEEIVRDGPVTLYRVIPEELPALEETASRRVGAGKKRPQRGG